MGLGDINRSVTACQLNYIATQLKERTQLDLVVPQVELLCYSLCFISCQCVCMSHCSS